MENLEEFNLSVDNFVDTTTKVSIKFLLDVSESMSWHGGIESMWAGISVFLDALKNDEYANECVEVSISTFNHEVNEILKFTSVKDIGQIQKFTASSTTNLSLAIHEAIENIEEQKKYYKDNGIRYKAPWLVLLTDGDIVPNEIDSAVALTTSKISSKKLTMFSIGTGNEVNIDQLKRFNPSKPVIFSPEEEDLTPLFEWLSQTTSGYSQVGEGEQFQTTELDGRYGLI